MFLGSFKHLPKRNVLMLQKLTFFHGGLKILPLNLFFGHTPFAKEGPTADGKDFKNCKSSSCLWAPTKNSKQPLTYLQGTRDPEIPSLRACMALEVAKHGLCSLRFAMIRLFAFCSRPPPWLSTVTPIDRFPEDAKLQGPYLLSHQGKEL